MKSIRQIKNLKNKRILVRIDANIPLINGKIDEEGLFRVQAIIPTVEYLLKKKAKILLVSHLGRPNGNYDKTLSLKPVCDFLSRLLKKEIHFLERVEDIEKSFNSSNNLFFLENIRFYKEEEKNDRKFAKNLAKQFDFFVNEAFSVCHRKTATTVAITKFLPSFAGLNLFKEVEVLSRVLKNPKKPFALIIGGVKAKTKIPVALKLCKTADIICFGGVLANQMRELSCSKKLENFDSSTMKAMFRLLKNKIVKIPKDVIARDSKTKKTLVKRIEFCDLDDSCDVMDIGPETIKDYCKEIKRAKMIVWNGPLGYFEDKKFRKATNAIAKCIAKSKSYKIVGGGETILAISQAGLLKKMSHVSVGGGAMLAFLSGEKMPGLKSLK